MSQSPVSPRCQTQLFLWLSVLGVLATPLEAQQQPETHKRGQDLGMVLRQVWPEARMVTSVSPDGRFVAYMGGDGDLVLRDLTTGESRQLTHKGTWEDSPEVAESPRFSPDGRRIAYGWRNRDFVYELRTINVDGSNERMLYKDSSSIIYPAAWFPDGTTVLAKVDQRGQDISLIAQISTTDGSLRVLKTVHGDIDDVSLSPDGRFVAYTAPPATGDAKPDIFVSAVDGGHETPLAQHPARDVTPVWTPDGKRIVFASDRRGSQDLWMIEVVDGEPRGDPVLVKPHIDQLGPVGFTQDGSYFYIVWYTWSDLFVAELDLVSGGFAGPPIEVSRRSPGPGDLPAWSADGKYLAYVSDRSPIAFGGTSTVLTIRSLETGDEREIPLGMPLRLWIGASVHWVPDGDSLFIRKFGDLYRVDLRTGDVALSEAFPPLTFSVTWSGDGRRMFYSVSDSNFQTGSVMVRDLATGREQTLYQGRAPGTLELSPDGRTLAFNVVEYSPKRVTLVLLPAEGGSIRELVTHADVADHPILGWTPDGSGIIYGREVGIQGAEGYDMWYISAQGGEPRRLEPTLNTWRPALHPDGRHFAFAVEEGSLELWALSNFLPQPR